MKRTKKTRKKFSGGGIIKQRIAKMEGGVMQFAQNGTE